MITNANELVKAVIISMDYNQSDVNLYSSFFGLQLDYMRIDYSKYSYYIKREVLNDTCFYLFTITHNIETPFYCTVLRSDIIQYYNAKKCINKEEMFRFELMFSTGTIFFLDFIEILYSKKLKVEPEVGFQDSGASSQYFFELYKKQSQQYVQSIK